MTQITASHVLEQVHDHSSAWVWIVAVTIIAYTISAFKLHALGPRAKFVGARSKFEARFVANARAFLSLRSIIREGYSKFGNKPFWFARNDCNMVVLPASQAKEIKALTAETANPTEAHAHNLLGPHTRMDLILKSDLHSRVLQTKLTPNLMKLFGPIQNELDYAMKLELPECKDQWAPIQPYHGILKLVARVSARAFVGLPYCRNETWLEITTQFTENVFKSLLILRAFPTWAHGLISPWLPTILANQKYVKRAQALLLPEIARYREYSKHGLVKPEPDTLLSWMVESAATDFETDSNFLAHLEVVISLASIHTTQMNAVHVLLDLAARPEYIEPIREEIAAAIAADGGWQKTSFARLRKLDSFMKESQRFSPPSMLSNHRLVKHRHVLSDGTIIRPNDHICMAAHSIDTDPSILPGADVFDGFRYERMRQLSGSEHRYQFTTTSEQSLHFGHGRYSCPGRFFAAMEIKSILCRLLMNYDFRLPEGVTERPKNIEAYEFIFPNPSAVLEMRERPRELQVKFGSGADV